MIQDAFVIGAVAGREVIRGFAYYAGEGEWTIWENAEVYYSRKALRSGMKEAREALPDGADRAVAFACLVE